MPAIAQATAVFSTNSNWRPHEKNFQIRTKGRERGLRRLVAEELQAHREIYAFKSSGFIAK